jgi:hypothetical protein
MVERVNARLKDEFGGRNIRVRGAAKVMAHLMFRVLALTVTALSDFFSLHFQYPTEKAPPLRCTRCHHLISGRTVRQTAGRICWGAGACLADLLVLLGRAAI